MTPTPPLPLPAAGAPAAGSWFSYSNAQHGGIELRFDGPDADERASEAGALVTRMLERGYTITVAYQSQTLRVTGFDKTKEVYRTDGTPAEVPLREGQASGIAPIGGG